MVQQRACAIGVDQIMSVYDDIREKYPFFSIWYNKSDKFIQSLTDDPEQTRDFLLTSLAVLEQSGDNAMYYLKIHPKFSEIYTRTGMEVCSIPFRLNQYEAGTGVSVNGYPPNPETARFKALQDEIAALKLQIEEMDDPEKPEQPDTLTRIAGFLDHPTIGPAIGQVLGAIIPKIIAAFPGLSDLASHNNAIVDRPPQIAGVTDTNTMTEDQKNEKIDEALDRLEPLCDLANDLTLLANMAEKNKPMFDSMLAILRAQK